MASAGPRKSATLRAASRQSSSPHRHRRQSETERIDEILENARERADSIAAESIPSTDDNPSPGGGGLRRSQLSLSFDDLRPDETTAFLSRRLSHHNSYQTLQNNGNGIPRARIPAYKRHSTSTVREDDNPGQPSEGENVEDGDDLPERGIPRWWDKATAPFRSIELENKGSVARDHLALERTFLAWLRTSLAFASIGIAITQLFRLNTSLPDADMPVRRETLRHLGRPLGAAFLAVSILILLLGYRRFFRGQQWIMRGKFPASRGTVLVLVLVTLSIMILSLVVVVVIHPERRS